MATGADIDKEIMKHQRMMLGVMCGLLAPLAVLFGIIGENPDEWWYSISATYYCNSKILMIGLLFTTFVYFLSYRGYDKRDNIITSISGIAALFVIAFPTNTSFVNDTELVGLIHLPVTTTNIIHCVSASILFVSFSVMILLQFTKSEGEMTPEKKKRNILYKICGNVINIFMAFQMFTATYDEYFPNWWTMVNETVMLTAFAVAWLCKAGCFKKLNDK
jgi:hypothetical protein